MLVVPDSDDPSPRAGGTPHLIPGVVIVPVYRTDEGPVVRSVTAASDIWYQPLVHQLQVGVDQLYLHPASVSPALLGGEVPVHLTGPVVPDDPECMILINPGPFLDRNSR